MRVEQLMTRPAITCTEHDLLDSAAHRMRAHDCGALPVVDDAGELIGILTDRDICMVAALHGRALHEIRVGEAMAGPVFVCQLGDPLLCAQVLMSDHQIRRVPIVDSERRPVGMISLTDIAREAARNGRRGAGATASATVVQTLAHIGAPRHFGLPAA